MKSKTSLNALLRRATDEGISVVFTREPLPEPGTFSVDEGIPLILLQADLVDDPRSLRLALAHALGHHFFWKDLAKPSVSCWGAELWAKDLLTGPMLLRRRLRRWILRQALEQGVEPPVEGELAATLAWEWALRTGWRYGVPPEKILDWVVLENRCADMISRQLGRMSRQKRRLAARIGYLERSKHGASQPWDWVWKPGAV
ncbi:MAG TPA: hypothetical protein GXX55_03540 [Firmicutes bacterium]|nr:hypothetical protein [Bacillota bacterium]